MKVSEAFFDLAYNLKVNRVYGNPGTTEIPLLKSLNEKKIMYILALHDGLSVGMAEGDYYYSKKAQIVNLHTVLGLGNSISFLFSALKNKVPMIVTIGQQDRRHSYYEPLLYGPNEEIVKPVVKEVLCPFVAEDVPKMLMRAHKVANTYPYGPVALILPMDMMDEECGKIEKIETNEFIFGDYEEMVNEIAEEINSSNNVAIVVGHEIEIFDAENELVEFSKKLRAPIYKEPLCSRGVIDNSNELFVGELLPASLMINQALANYDLILLIGGNFTLYPYFPFELLKDKKIIELSYDYKETTKNNWKVYICNVKNVLKKLCDLVIPKNFKRDEIKEIKLFSKAATVRNQMGIEYLFYRISKFIKDETIFDESISATMTLKDYLPIKPKKYFAARTGHLGWAMPVATAYGIVGGDAIAIIGDGSFNYSSQSLWSAKRYNANTSFIILDNRGYGILKSYSLARYPELLESDWLSPETNAEKIANSYGIEAKSVTTPEELDNSISWVLNNKEPRLLRIEIDRSIPKLF